MVFPPIYVTTFGGNVANNSVLSFENITYENLSFTLTSLLDIDLGTMGDLQIDGFVVRNIDISNVRGLNIQIARYVSINNMLIDGVTLNKYMLIKTNSDNIDAMNITIQNLQGEATISNV